MISNLRKCTAFQCRFDNICQSCSHYQPDENRTQYVFNVGVPQASIQFNMEKAIFDTLTYQEHIELFCKSRLGHCPGRLSRCHFSRTLKLTTSPMYLIVQLNFFDRKGKLKSYCKPVENLQIKIQGKLNNYALECIVQHIGETKYSGHYVSYVLNRGKWFCTNDQDVKCINKTQLPLQPFISIFKRTVSEE